MNRRTTLGEKGDLKASPGSRLWAVAVRDKLSNLLKETEFSAEQANRYFEAMQKYEGWKQLEDKDGYRFMSFETFCCCDAPFGLGYDSKHIDRIIRDRREKEAAERAREAEPGPRRGEVGRGRDRSDNVRPKQSGNNADYLADRIARDAPDVLERMKQGEFKSVRQAAIAAGIVKVKTPEEKAIAALKKCNAEQLKRVIEWIHEYKEEEARETLLSLVSD